MKGILQRVAAVCALLPITANSLMGTSWLFRYGRSVETLPHQSKVRPGVNATGCRRSYPPWNPSPNIDRDGFLKDRYQRVRRYFRLPSVMMLNSRECSFPELDCLVRQVPDDASSLFHAIVLCCHGFANSSDCLYADLNNTESMSWLYQKSAALRQQVVHSYADSMMQRTHLYYGGQKYIETQKFVEIAAMIYGIDREEHSGSLQEYCRLMQDERTWPGGVEIVALSNLLERPIHVYELAEQGISPSRFVLRRIHCFGSPNFDHNKALHILSADSRFPDLAPGEQQAENNQFFAMFPQTQGQGWEHKSSELPPKKHAARRRSFLGLSFLGLHRLFGRGRKGSLPRSTNADFRSQSYPPWNPSPNIDNDGFVRQLYERVPEEWEDPVDSVEMFHEKGFSEGQCDTRCLVRQVPGDGSCLLYAISLCFHFATSGFHLDLNSTDSVSWLCQHSAEFRQLAVHCFETSMRQRKHLYVTDDQYVEARHLVASAARENGISRQEYCRLMQDERTWAGGPEIVALCNVLERPIHVYELAESLSPKDEHGLPSPPHFVLRRMACFGSPKFDHNTALHILSADSRFPDLVPGQPRFRNGNHFLAMFPMGQGLEIKDNDVDEKMLWSPTYQQ